MRIAHLVAGAGATYCGTCLQGDALARALGQLGADVALVPLYTPLRTEGPSRSGAPLAYGGINVFLQQASALFRHTPAFLERWLDHPALVTRAARLGGAQADRLGPLVVSMLQGEHGRQRKELEKLVAWLAAEVRPQVVHLATALLAGLAGEIAHRLGATVVCSLSGEDLFLDEIPEPHRRQARELIGRCCRELPALVAMNRAYADRMAEYLSVPREKIRVIRPGLDLGLTPGGTPGATREPSHWPVVGYLGRIRPEKGLHVLLEAVGRLDQPARLVLAGSLERSARPYLERLRSRAAELGLGERFHYAGELDRARKDRFLAGLDLFCYPCLFCESKALPVLEAWSNGVPAVLPNVGPMPEMVEHTGGGLLYEAADPDALAHGIKRLVADPHLAMECARRAQRVVRAEYTAERMAREVLALYEELLPA